MTVLETQWLIYQLIWLSCRLMWLLCRLFLAAVIHLRKRTIFLWPQRVSEINWRWVCSKACLIKRRAYLHSSSTSQAYAMYSGLCIYHGGRLLFLLTWKRILFISQWCRLAGIDLTSQLNRLRAIHMKNGSLIVFNQSHQSIHIVLTFILNVTLKHQTLIFLNYLIPVN